MAELRNIHRDDKINAILLAEIRGERIDSGDRENAAKLIKDLGEQADNAQARHMIAQLVENGVRALAETNGATTLKTIADYKEFGFNEKAEFDIPAGALHAVVQAKGATTPRSLIGNNKVEVPTVELSVRPAIKIVDLKRNTVDVAKVITEAYLALQGKELEYAAGVLSGVMANLGAKFYGTGNGLVAATLNPLVRYWMRTGGAAILGDIEEVGKVAELTGFAANGSTKQFSDAIINEQNTFGHIGKYLGADVLSLANPYTDEANGVTALPVRDLFILPTSQDTKRRGLKVAVEGPVQMMDAQSIDDKTLDIRLDQWFGAAFAYGNTPGMSIYHDSSN